MPRFNRNCRRCRPTERASMSAIHPSWRTRLVRSDRYIGHKPHIDKTSRYAKKDHPNMHLLRTGFLMLFMLPLLTGCGAGGIAPVAGSPLAISNATPPTMSPTPQPAPIVNPPAVPTCVTFIGDSLTQFWPMANLSTYDGGCYINHGRAGTTMPQILDGIDDHALPYDATVDPATSRIVLVGGDVWNDLVADMTVPQMEETYTAVIAKLQGMGVQVVLCTLMPSHRPDFNANFNAQVVELNDWIRTKGAAAGIPVADIYAVPPFVLADGSLNPAETDDGIHIQIPTYVLLTTTIEGAIHEAGAKL